MTSDTVPAKPTGRWLRIALIVSLALNVLIIGGVASGLIFSHHYGWDRHGRRHSLLLRFAETLPAEQADAIRKTVLSERSALDPLRKAKREARDAARSVLTTEPFDLQKFRAALDRIAEADAKEKRARMTIFADTVANFTPEERRQLHDWFEKRRARRDRWRKED